MRGPRTTDGDAFKQGFFKNLILSLGAFCRSASSPGETAMSVHERKRAIKQSADVAMAATRGAGARWPRALLLLASSSSRPTTTPSEVQCRRSKVVIRRCRPRRRRDGGGTGSSLSSRTALAISSREVARRLVRKRTEVLRSMIPGGEMLADEVTLLREAMDYVAHLRAQVDVLRRISKAVG
jgi:hypothetical protein